MSEPTLHSESVTSAAIDGARISTFTATALTELDPDIPPMRRQLMLAGLEQARAILDQVRELIPVITTSLHQVIEVEGR